MRDVSCTHYKQFSITPLSSSKILRTMLLSFQFQFLVNLKQKVFYWNIEISNWIFTYFCFANWSELSFQQHTHGLVPYSPTSNTDDISITRRSLEVKHYRTAFIFYKQFFKKKSWLIVPKKQREHNGNNKSQNEMLLVLLEWAWGCFIIM